MRANIAKVLAAMVEGQPANGDKSKQNGQRICSTDGTVLYSYRMPIARIVKRARVKSPGVIVRGVVEIVEYDRAPTATTRTHVAAARSRFKFDLAGSYDVVWVQEVNA